MSLNAMAFTKLRVSSFTSSLASNNSRPSIYQPWNLSLQSSKIGMVPNKLSIKSVAFSDKVPSQTYLGTKDLDQVIRKGQEALLNSSDPLRTLKIIDTIQKLGIEHHFEKEINLQLGRVGDWDTAEDLFATALQFRLLRHNGWPTCSGAKGEEVLQQAMDYSRAHLCQSLPHLSPKVRSIVAEALKLPRHQRMVGLEAKNYMVEYSQASNQIPALLKLARLDYDMIQSMHQKELAEISRWWKDLGLIERLGFGRDGPRECFLWALGIFPEPRHSSCRIELAKAICVLQVIDDVFDTYGTLDELVLFTKAIKRWDLDAMEQLPEYMKICYMALYNTTHEIAYKIQKDHSLTVVACLKITWIDLIEAYLKEANWFNNKHVPTFQQYLDNGVISSGSYLALVHATFLIGDDLSKETIFMMNPYPRLFSCSGKILRLWDDLGTSRDEQERGDNACSIQCLMKQNNISDENVARKLIRQLIDNLWPELNGLTMTTNLPLSVMRASLNMARTSQVIYRHGDDQNMPTVDEHVQTLLFTPSINYRDENDINHVI
ncbi:putative terpene synthase 11 [Glycine soja]